MKKRKLVALAVSASMTLNTLGYAVFADETEEVIKEEVQESTEQTDQIPEETEVAETAEEPEITDESAIPEETEIVEEIPEEIAEAIVSAPFNQEAEIDGVIVSVIADEGVFPEGACLVVTRVEDPEADSLVQENLDEGSDVAYAYTFDISIFDSEGIEIEPNTEAGCVYVSFTNELVSDPNLDMDIYHITEDEMVELDINIEEDTAIASTDGFSYYSVVFTRESYTYNINNYTLLTANALATHVGLNGEVTSAVSADPDKVNVYVDANDLWFVSVNGPFTETVNITITINSTDYTIGVTTDTTAYSTGDDGQMGFQISGNGKGFDVYGYDGDEIVRTSYTESAGYRTHMSIVDEHNVTQELIFYNAGSSFTSTAQRQYINSSGYFAFGDVYTLDGVEAYLTAEVIDGVVYVTYTMTNTGTETRNVSIGSGCDCMIGGNDKAVIEEYNGGLVMREDLKLRSNLTTPDPSLNHHNFYLTSGIGSFSTLYSNGYNVDGGYEKHIFDSGVKNVLNAYPSNTNGLDGALCYSWNLDIAPGETVRRVAVFSVTDSAEYYTVTYNPNNSNSSNSAYSASVLAHVPAQLNANTFTAPDGLAFKGWATSANGPVVYRNQQTIEPDGALNLYAIWKPVAVMTSEPQASTSPVYTGDPVDLVDRDNAGSGTGGTVQYSTDGGNTWSSDIPTATDPGNYTVQYKIAGDDDHADSDTGSFNVTVLSAPEARSGLRYTGSDQALVTAPSAMPAGYERVLYSLNGETWDEEIPTGNAVNTYNVQYKFVDEDGIENDITGSVSVEIAKATASIGTSQKPTVPNLSYTGEAQYLVTAPESVPAGYTVMYSTDGEHWNVDRPQGTNATDYTVYYMYDGDANHEDITSDTFVLEPGIAPAALDLSTLTDAQKPTVPNLSYTGNPQYLVTAPESVPAGYTVMYSTDGEHWNVDRPQGTNATDYTVYYMYYGDANHEDITSDTFVLEPGIATAALDLSTLTDAQKPTVPNLSYTGNPQYLVTAPESVPAGYTVMYSTDGEHWNVDRPQGTNATDYTVYYMYDGDANHEDITSDTFVLTPSIAPAAAPDLSTLTDAQKPTVPNLSYTGNPQDLVTAPTAGLEGYTVMYSTDGTNWSESIPQGTNATDYTVYYMYDGDANHEDITSSTFVLEPGIAPAAAPDLSTLTDAQKPHGVTGLYHTGDAYELVSEPDNLPTGYDQILYSIDGGDWSPNIPQRSAMGTYEISYKYVDSNNNHTEFTGGPISVTIYAGQAPDPSSLAPEQRPTAVTGLEYDGQPHELVTGPASYPDNYEEIWYSTDGGDTWINTLPVKTDAGEYTVKYKYVDSQGEFAEFIGGEVSVAIQRGEAPDATSLAGNQIPAAVDGLTYTGSAQALVTAPSALPSGYEQVWYSTDNGATWSQNIPTGTDAGNYNVSVKYVDADHNLEDLTGVTVPVTIAPAEAPDASSLTGNQIPAAVDGLAYTGSAQALVNAPSVLPSGYEQVWYSTDGGNTWSQSIPPGTDAGDYNVSVKYVDTDNNYADLIGVTVPVTIAPAAAPDASSLTASQRPAAVSGLTYTGEAQALVTAPSSLPTGYDEVWYSTDDGNTWSQSIPTGTDAGNYNVSVRYVDTDGNYADLTGVTVPVTIASAAAAELTADQIPTAASGLTYTGSAQALVTAPSSLPDGYEQVWYSLDGGNTWSQTIPMGIDAGTYTVSVRYVDADGILPDIYGPDITVSIAAATATAVIAGESSTVTVGQPLTRPADPSRYGYDFTGWYVDEACTIPYDFNTPIGVLGVSLYPGWTPVAYTLVSGAGSSFNAASTPNLVFRAVRNNNEPSTFSHFTGIKVDGNVVAAENYTAVSGSVIVTLNADYLKTLSVGEHTLEILFNDGPSVTTTFTIVASVASTGEIPYSVYPIIGALLIATAAAFVFKAGSREA